MAHTNLKNLKALSMGLALVALTAVGCQKAANSTAIDSRANGARSQVSNATSTYSDISLMGWVYTTAQDQTSFNEKVRDFMSSSVPSRDWVGYVSSEALDNTGVYLGGKVTLANGASVCTSQAVQSSIAQNSRIRISVIDYNDGQTLKPLPEMNYNQVTGSVVGNRAEMLFSDSWGTVHIIGTFDANNFVGSFSFSTTRDYNQTPVNAQEKVLGNFTVPTKSFFGC